MFEAYEKGQAQSGCPVDDLDDSKVFGAGEFHGGVAAAASGQIRLAITLRLLDRWDLSGIRDSLLGPLRKASRMRRMVMSLAVADTARACFIYTLCFERIPRIGGA